MGLLFDCFGYLIGVYLIFSRRLRYEIRASITLMSVVWGTVKDHDGYIDITTEEGGGTTFTLYFPTSRSEIQTSSTVYIEDYLGKGESILIVDDSPEQRELAQRMMQRLGYEVFTAASGEEAVSLVNKRQYDLLILDMIMPPEKRSGLR